MTKTSTGDWAISSTLITPRGVSIMAQISCRRPDAALRRLRNSTTSSARSTFGKRSALAGDAANASMSSSHQGVPDPLQRTTSSRLPYPPCSRTFRTSSRALIFESAATASSRSKITTSQAKERAFAIARSLIPGMNNAERRGLISRASSAHLSPRMLALTKDAPPFE